jgi:hypothetical protein
LPTITRDILAMMFSHKLKSKVTPPVFNLIEPA